MRPTFGGVGLTPVRAHHRNAQIPHLYPTSLRKKDTYECSAQKETSGHRQTHCYRKARTRVTIVTSRNHTTLPESVRNVINKQVVFLCPMTSAHRQGFAPSSTQHSMSNALRHIPSLCVLQRLLRTERQSWLIARLHCCRRPMVKAAYADQVNARSTQTSAGTTHNTLAHFRPLVLYCTSLFEML